MKTFILFLVCCCFFETAVFPQNKVETGYPLIDNYTPKEYGAFQANWAVSQDNRGIMYFGNDIGLLEFDGTSWRLYQVPNKTTVRSIANGSDGKLYIGAVGELGYFMSGTSGRLIYHSLMKFVPKNRRDFADVWETYFEKGKVYFNTTKYILIWNIQRKEFKIIPAEYSFHEMFDVNGSIYEREWKKGLEILKNDSLIFLKGSEKFANERIYVMLPFPGKTRTILIVSRTTGLFKYNGGKFIPFKTAVDKFIKDNLIYYPGTVLSDGNILLGTLSGGAIVIDTSGNEINVFNLKSGIISNTIDFSFQDRAGAVWLATDNGITRIDYSSPVSYFDARSNLLTTPTDLIRYKGIMYTAGNNGVYYLKPGTSVFQLFKNGNNQYFSLLKTGNELLVGGYNGLFSINNFELNPVRKTVGNEYNVFVLKQSRVNPDRIYVGAQGLWSVLKNKNGWKDEGRILDIPDEVSAIIEDNDGTLWIGSNISGVFRIKFKKDKDGKIILAKPDIEHFGKNNGLQSGYMYIDKINGTNYFVTTDSCYKFDKNRKLFYSDTSDYIISSFYKMSGSKSVTFFQQDSLGRLWLGTRNTLAMGTPLPGGKYKWLTAPFKRFAGDQINKVYAEKNGVVWLLAGLGLIRYDFSKEYTTNRNYYALVRSVEIGRDSTIYFGGLTSGLNVPAITYKDNSVKFKFSATSYEGKNTNRFKTFLKGFDDDWSPWSTEDAKEYTNLPPGSYTFNVKAENISGLVSDAGSFSFEILPPWYRTFWAYAGYVILFGFMIFGIDRLQRKRVTMKERQRSQIREMKLRTEAAESESKALQAENERKKNVELLSEIGKEITATLDLDTIFYKLYEHVNQLADATIFGVGIYYPGKNEIEYRLAMEKGKRYPVYTRDTKDKNQFPVWCIENKRPVFINDVSKEYKNYIENYKEPETVLEDGTMSEEPRSLIYLPLISKDKILGVITIQSFQINAYRDYHLNILQNLASYTSIALDNADAYDRLNETVNKLNSTLNDLKSTQEILVTKEKLASLGALTAGIAHEIKNPLNFVNNFSEISFELAEDLEKELKEDNIKEVENILKDLKQNLEKINQHGRRADSIVKNMLLHSRGTSGEKLLTDINELLEQYVNLSYHGIRAQNKDFNITIEKNYDPSLGQVKIVPQDISRVFLNIINNACYAADEKRKITGNGFVPVLKVSTVNLPNKVEIRIRDNGNGIPEEIRDKLFNPFFTTKPAGEGTGLGLSLSYDIVTKVHGGEIKFVSEVGKFTEFIITIPKT